MLTGALFVGVLAAIGIWSIWQRRHAWGWWETPTTVNVGLLTLGAGFASPVLLHRSVCTPAAYGVNLYCYWGRSYVIGAVLTFVALASFAVGLKRRTRHGVPDRRWIAFMVKLPTAAAIAVMVGAYGASGAWSNPWVLDPLTVAPSPSVRLFWSAIGVSMAYLLALISALLLQLRADSRRGDHGPILVYLGSCAAGIVLTVVAIATAAGFGSGPFIVVDSAVLFALMFGGSIGVGGMSWRRKVRRLAAPMRERLRR